MCGVLRVFVLAVISSILISPVIAEAPVSARSWSGFYIGVSAGHAWGNADFATVPGGNWANFPADAANFQSGTSKSLEFDNFSGGVHIGYSAQVGRLVFGLEADISTLSADTTLTGGVAGTGITTRIQHAEMSWLATMRARFGVSMDRLLIYGTGGLAIANSDVSIYLEGAGDEAFFARSSVQTGWLLGGGLEYALDGRWSLKGEYLFADFGSIQGASQFSGGGVGFTQQHSVDLSVQLARIGLNYKY